MSHLGQTRKSSWLTPTSGSPLGSRPWANRAGQILFGAGEGNRTLVFSLEGCCSTIELHPRWRSTITPGARPQPSCLVPVINLVPPSQPAAALNTRRFATYTEVSINKRKEVIQCLLPSAVTSLGSPAKLIRLGNRAFSAPDQRVQKSGRGGNPAASFCLGCVTPS